MSHELEQSLLDLLELPCWIRRVLRKEARKVAPQNPLDQEVGHLGPIGFTGRELMEGLIAIGGKGAGKSSCLAGLLRQLYDDGWCGHILCVKTEEFPNQLRLLENRLDDVIVIGPGLSMTVGDPDGSAATINAVAYEYEQSGRNIESVAQLFGTLMELVEGHSSKGHDGKSQFFQRSGMNACRMATALLAPLGCDVLNFLYIGELIKTAPVSTDAKPDDTAFWTVCQQVRAIRDTLPPAKREDADRAFAFFVGPWARLAEETRSSIIATISSMVELFSLSPLREMFCEATNVRPRDCWEKNKILLHAATIHGNGVTGKMIQIIWKYLFMRDAERRDASIYKVPCLTVEDEFQETIVKNYDLQFTAIVRAKLIATIIATQTLSAIHTVVGNKHESDALIANYRNRVVFSSDDPETTKTCSEWIGQTTKILPGPPKERSDPLDFWSSYQPGNWHSTRGPEIEPADFARLLKGGAHGEAEAIVYKGGADMGNGRTWRRAMIPQWFG